MTANQIRPILEDLAELKQAVADLKKQHLDFKKDNDEGHDRIETKLTPLLEEKKFRDTLDQQVSKWLPRVPYIVAIVSAILYVLITKAVMPMIMKFEG